MLQSKFKYVQELKLISEIFLNHPNESLNRSGHMHYFYKQTESFFFVQASRLCDEKMSYKLDLLSE